MNQSSELRVYGGIKLYAEQPARNYPESGRLFRGKPVRPDIIEFPNENLFVKLHSSVRGRMFM